MHLKRILKEEKRNIEQIRKQYEIEKRLATRLRNASKEERRNLYSTLYNELYQKISYHSQLVRKANAKEQAKATSGQIRLLKNFLDKSYTFLELGAGDCNLSCEIAKYVKKVYAIDVSDEVTKTTQQPKNFTLILSNGSSINLPPESINVAYSHQLMEHLHPNDAVEQLQGIYNALALGGIYICITPHRFMGPADISKYFDDVATGFHLKEYTNNELYKLFKTVGFSRIQSLKRKKETYIKFPIYLAIVVEYLLSPLPYRIKRKLSRMLLFRHLLSIRLIAKKR